MAVTVSFLGGNGQIQSMDLPAGIDVGSYFANQQPIPLSALGDKFQGFFGSPAGQSWLQTPEATAWGAQALPAAQTLFGGGSSPGQTLTIPGAGAALAQNSGSILTGLTAAAGVPQFLSGLGNLGSNVAAGGFSGALMGLPEIPATLANSAAGLGVIGLGEAPVGAQAATGGLIGAGGELGGLLPGLGAAASIGTGIADLVQGNIPGGAGSLGGAALGAGIGSFVPGVGTLLGAAIGGGAGGILGDLFGGGHTKGSHIDLPGVAPGGFDTRTAGGTNTVFKSYGEGLGALSPFQEAVRAAGTDPQKIAAAFNQQYSPFPGQFRVESHGPTDSFIPQQGTVTGPGAWNYMNLGGTGFAPNWSPWTAAALQDPRVIANLDIQAGMLGAPAEQTSLEESLRAFLGGLGTPSAMSPVVPAAVTPSISAAPAGMTTAPVSNVTPNWFLASLERGGA